MCVCVCAQEPNHLIKAASMNETKPIHVKIKAKREKKKKRKIIRFSFCIEKRKSTSIVTVDKRKKKRLLIVFLCKLIGDNNNTQMEQ